MYKTAITYLKIHSNDNPANVNRTGSMTNWIDSTFLELSCTSNTRGRTYACNQLRSSHEGLLHGQIIQGNVGLSFKLNMTSTRLRVTDVQTRVEVR